MINVYIVLFKYYMMCWTVKKTINNKTYFGWEWILFILFVNTSGFLVFAINLFK